MRRAAIVVGLLAVFMAGANAASVCNFEIPVGVAGPAIRLLVWTPCAEPPREMDARGATFFAAPGCAVVGSKLPLIVLSHGRRGWFGGHHDTAAALADAGFVVAALNHSRDNIRDTSGTDSLEVLVERPYDIKRLVDYMLADWPDASRINAERIGIYGFSFGGYSALVAIGGKPDLRKGFSACQTSTLRACQQLENGERTERPFANDPRIKAAVVIDPYPTFVFAEDGLNGIAAPIQLWSSDPTLKLDRLSGCCAFEIIDKLSARPDFHFVPNAKHFSFLATCNAKDAEAAPSICLDAPGFDRAAFHERLHRDVIAFFRNKLPENASKP